jgi:hypothetical protein
MSMKCGSHKVQVELERMSLATSSVAVRVGYKSGRMESFEE